jgi:ATP/maltotriose-dependent transcriptional regulator MalT
MNLEDLNRKKTPIIKIDTNLEWFRGKIVFPEKLQQANEILKNVGISKL